jgi:hypothetical protein
VKFKVSSVQIVGNAVYMPPEMSTPSKETVKVCGPLTVGRLGESRFAAKKVSVYKPVTGASKDCVALGTTVGPLLWRMSA